MLETRASPDPAQLNAVFHALSDEKRRIMVAWLSSNAMSVKALAEPLGMRLPAAVKHLAILEASGMVSSEKTGRVRTYTIKTAAFSSINQWIAGRETAMNAAFDRLDQAIAQFPMEADE